MPEELTIRSYLFMLFVYVVGRSICFIQRCRGRLILHNFERFETDLARGATLFIASHPTRLEDILLQVNTPGLWRHPAKRFLWVVADHRPFKGWAETFEKNARCIMFDRTDSRSAAMMARVVKQKLRDLMSVLIFVEGGRTYGDSLQTELVSLRNREMRLPLVNVERFEKDTIVRIRPIYIHVPFAQHEHDFAASLWRWLTRDVVIEVFIGDLYQTDPSLSNIERQQAIATAILSA